MTDKKYGAPVFDSKGNITSLHGCELRFENFSDANSDYWLAWVNGVQDDGLTQNEAIENAYKRSQKA
jgi:hypothetical protein